MPRERRTVEYGDFQTPGILALRVCRRLKTILPSRPCSIVEPTCGLGSFLLAAARTFDPATTLVGLDVDVEHLRAARASLRAGRVRQRFTLIASDFFLHDWARIGDRSAGPVLFLGNLPWVTNSALGVFGGSNLPEKGNLEGRRGIEAITGTSNFDISEWMLRRLLESNDGRATSFAFLCKTGVARKILSWLWTRGAESTKTALYRIDARKHFDATVDACLLVISTRHPSGSTECPVYGSLEAATPESVLGYRASRLVANVPAFDRTRHLLAQDAAPWRSGIKHDCARVFELRKEGAQFVNGLDQHLDPEPDHVFPLLKSSDLARGESTPRKWLLVPQRSTGEDTNRLRTCAPNVWAYLEEHAKWLDARKSSIYRARARFSIFGVGPYSFSPWKVGISGLYKRLTFTKIGPFAERPVVLDDTGYFLPCRTEAEADTLLSLLTSDPAQEFFAALVFWDTKRPISVEVLRLLDLRRLAQEIGGPERPVPRWTSALDEESLVPPAAWR